MSDASELSGFNGLARLFPLPNLVLFPHVVQPLHVFEPRYRQMTADALETDRLIALVLLRPGWEADYQGQPAIHQVVCVGRIVADQGLPDGRYNLLLRGLSRARIAHELDTGKLYRSARVELVPDQGQVAARKEKDLRHDLAGLLAGWFAAQAPVLEQFRKLLESDLPLGALCDVFSFALPLDVEFKQQLLEEADVARRVDALTDHLRTRQPAQPGSPAARGFPPAFSSN